MLAVFAEFETNLRRERQLEGIAFDPARVKQLKSHGLGPTEIARTLRINRASVYRGEIEASASNASR